MDFLWIYTTIKALKTLKTSSFESDFSAPASEQNFVRNDRRERMASAEVPAMEQRTRCIFLANAYIVKVGQVPTQRPSAGKRLQVIK